MFPKTNCPDEEWFPAPCISGSGDDCAGRWAFFKRVDRWLLDHAAGVQYLLRSPAACRINLHNRDPDHANRRLKSPLQPPMPPKPMPRRPEDRSPPNQKPSDHARMTATLPTMAISAPMRRSSSTYLNRLEKTVSLTMLVPLANGLTVCGCISVGNPGCGRVCTLTARSGRRQTLAPCCRISTPAPISRSLAVIASMCSGMTGSMHTPPHQRAPLQP